jgi:hypothetical protein
VHRSSTFPPHWNPDGERFYADQLFAGTPFVLGPKLSTLPSSIQICGESVLNGSFSASLSCSFPERIAPLCSFRPLLESY